MNITRRDFLKAAGAGALAAALPFPLSFLEGASRPNIIYLNVDDLGWADVGYQGSTYYLTPNIDKLASQGMVFTNGYAPAANCAPSRACCMTGQYTPRHGIYTVGSSERGSAKDRKLIPTKNTESIKEDNLTIAYILEKAGYKTCHIGKWHISGDPCKNGFDVNIGGNHAGHPSTYFSPYKNKNLKDGPKGEYLTDRLTDEAVSFITENKTGPFFLYFAWYTVHTPHMAKKEKIDKFNKREKTKGQNKAVYAAMIESLDESVGKLTKALDDLGLAESTLLVFTSDNGGLYRVSRQWPLREGKGSYYEGGIREPFIVRWPGHVKPGSKCDTPVSGIDFFPTFCEATGVKPPNGKLLDGVSFKPLLEGGKIEERPLFWHFPVYLQGGSSESRDPKFRTRPGSVVRLGDWKLHEYFEDGALLLYNLKDDVGEKNDLSKKHPEKVKELHELLKEWREETGAPVPTQLNPAFRPD